ncbi:MAG: tRNA (N(6)-L-threonylcarbamoyladenosine(37)-C(2))-methylthiotransferase MtaB [Chloroflexi bacterium]|nr:tRNA (N(6)-L-threonylcarbamoyladenosine(37)-C(2))-methylthiotransferase MtaB [Chloroflexota bacterium]
MRVAFYTLGCKLNQAETESLVGRFSQSGFQLVSPNDVADIYIANTCTVTHIADRKSRHWLRLAKRRNPQALIIATGCYAQRSPQELAQLADFVVDNKEKEHLLEIVTNPSLPTSSFVLERTPLRHCERSEAILPIAAASRTRSLIKIQNGCHGPCTYCIVPRVRPREYSLPAAQIIDEVKQKVALGYKEVVLTGTKVGSYKDAVLSGSEGPSIDLKQLVQRILHDTDIKRLRLSSLQPSEISPEFLALWHDERLCRHFHLALQSGSETVLQRMKRSYSLDQYQTTIDLIKEMMPDAAITTDIMVGFPGETDAEFEQSYSFCQQAGFANIHVFPFSPRPQTAAARMPGQIEDKVKKQRNQRMLELSRSSRRRFCEQFLGQTMPVLWEKEMPTSASILGEVGTSPGSGVHSGLTSNYIRVFARSKKSLTNEITPVKLIEFHDQGMWGEIVDENPG